VIVDGVADQPLENLQFILDYPFFVHMCGRRFLVCEQMVSCLVCEICMEFENSFFKNQAIFEIQKIAKRINLNEDELKKKTGKAK
jgi:hypothetical protein